MAIDPQQIGALALEFMATVEQKYGEEAEVGALMIVAAIDHGAQDSIEFRVSNGRGDPLPSYIARGVIDTLYRGIG